MASFEESIPIIKKAIERRRHKWTLNIVGWMDWEDVSAEIFIHIMKKWSLFDESRGTPIEAWLDRVIYNQIINKLEGLYYNHKSPCVNCQHNLGEGNCAIFGEYSSECSLYDKYIKSGKKDARDVKFPVSLNASVDSEGHSTLADFISDKQSLNIDDLSDQFHVAMHKVLTPFESRVYTVLFEQHKTEREAAREFYYQFKESGITSGVREIKKIKARIFARAQEVIRDFF